jgi:hypothetical protein
MSRISAPARKAMACPSAVAMSGLVVSRDLDRFSAADGRVHRAHDFFAGRIAEGVDDAAMAVPPFLREGDLAVLDVEVRAVADQLANALRRFTDDEIDDFAIA